MDPQSSDTSPERPDTSSRPAGRSSTQPESSDPKPSVPTAPDWHRLRAAAQEVRGHAHAPYSHFPVGAAGLVDDGRVVVGTNVENCSYGLTLCAECGMVSSLVATGGGRLVAVSCVGPEGLVTPCGRCRQILFEMGGPDCLVDASDGPVAMSVLLPGAFDLGAR